jgi:mannose-6-phosphate isomerase-like protein (cupin superfamily)
VPGTPARRGGSRHEQDRHRLRRERPPGDCPAGRAADRHPRRPVRHHGTLGHGRHAARPADSDTSTRAWQLEPPPGGSCFRIVEIAPGGDDGAGPAGQDAPDAEHEGFQDAHATDTLDYVTVLRGEVVLVVGVAEVTLGPGDSVVQQPGVPHDWQNRSAERTVLAGVLLSARQP